MIAWERWLGLPWRKAGRERSGVDCWGLLRLFYEEEMSIDLPAYDGATSDVMPSPDGWCEVYAPRATDAVLIRRAGGLHCAVIAPGGLLHIEQSGGSRISPNGSLFLSGPKTFYRWGV